MVLVALVGVPAAWLTGGSWFEMARAVPGDTRPLPQWVVPGDVRASTSDGALVKVRVALDASTSSNKSAIEHRLRDVTTVLQVSVGDQSVADLAGGRGIRQLETDMQRRINAYLQGEGLDPLKAVAIQDLWYKTP